MLNSCKDINTCTGVCVTNIVLEKNNSNKDYDQNPYVTFTQKVNPKNELDNLEISF